MNTKRVSDINNSGLSSNHNVLKSILSKYYIKIAAVYPQDFGPLRRPPTCTGHHEVIRRLPRRNQLLQLLLSCQPVLGTGHDTKVVTTSAPKFLECPFLHDSRFQKNCHILRTGTLSKIGILQKEWSYLLAEPPST
jgi:hypothetical protein